MPAAKRPPTKHQPKGLTILYEDKDIIVVEKNRSGLLTIGDGPGQVENGSLPFSTSTFARVIPAPETESYIVHRLDRETSGILVLAKSEAAKMYLGTLAGYRQALPYGRIWHACGESRDDQQLLGQRQCIYGLFNP